MIHVLILRFSNPTDSHDYHPTDDPCPDDPLDSDDPCPDSHDYHLDSDDPLDSDNPLDSDSHDYHLDSDDPCPDSHDYHPTDSPV